MNSPLMWAFPGTLHGGSFATGVQRLCPLRLHDEPVGWVLPSSGARMGGSASGSGW